MSGQRGRTCFFHRHSTPRKPAVGLDTPRVTMRLSIARHQRPKNNSEATTIFGKRRRVENSSVSPRHRPGSPSSRRHIAARQVLAGDVAARRASFGRRHTRRRAFPRRVSGVSRDVVDRARMDNRRMVHVDASYQSARVFASRGVPQHTRARAVIRISNQFFRNQRRGTTTVRTRSPNSVQHAPTARQREHGWHLFTRPDRGYDRRDVRERASLPDVLPGDWVWRHDEA